MQLIFKFCVDYYYYYLLYLGTEDYLEEDFLLYVRESWDGSGAEQALFEGVFEYLGYDDLLVGRTVGLQVDEKGQPEIM